MPVEAPVIRNTGSLMAFYRTDGRTCCTDPRTDVEIRAGAGGNGSLSFRREAHVPKGGPDGGDGGRGGDVILRCDDSVRDLQSFRRRVHFRAEHGGHGSGSQRHGADGDPLIVPVPPGTQVERWDGTRYDLVRAGQEVTIARGGSGGRGNTRFKSSTRQTPRLAERGLPGEEGRVDLHLKLLADVGLVGLPNAGKSSLLARLTRAQPKVAAYPFTTLEPVLGVLETRRPPAGDRRHPRADRGRERRRRARSRLPRPRRAHAPARARARPRSPSTAPTRPRTTP